MYSVSRLAAALAALSLQACAAAPPPHAATTPAEHRAPVTILISIDGFRADYLQRGVTPVLSRLAAEGASGPMRPSFPSKTYPNHWTIVTGLRPDRHGIVANRFEDPARPDEVFKMTSEDPFWWNAAEPIWVDAERAGIRTGAEFWPGSNIAIGGTRAEPKSSEVTGGVRPSDWAAFHEAITGEQRVNGVLDWLRRPAAIRPRFLTLYFDAVDHAGHDHGPADPETLDAVAGVDARIGDLLDGLAALGQPANLVIVADHGMAATSSERVIPLTDYVAKDDVHIVETGPYAALAAVPGKEAAVDKALLGVHPHMQCWRKEAFPARLHYGVNPRVPAILCLAEEGWLIDDEAPKEAFTGGAHGYDVAAPSMTALFVAHGPAFRPARLPAFDNVDVYPLLRDLLGLPAKPGVDGSDAVFGATLRR